MQELIFDPMPNSFSNNYLNFARSSYLQLATSAMPMLSSTTSTLKASTSVIDFFEVNAGKLRREFI